MAVSQMRTRCYFCVPDAPLSSVNSLNKAFSDIKSLNVNYVRIPLPWASLQPQQGTYSWGQPDEMINAALAAGVQPLVVLAPPFPSWVTTISQHSTTFATMASTVANRYKAGGFGIRAVNAGKGVLEYQIWDEPNVSENWPSGVRAGEYAAYLKASYTAIKTAQPGATVIFGGLQSCTDQLSANPKAVRRVVTASIVTNREPAGFLADAYAAGVKNHFDIMAYHPPSISTRQNPKPPAPSLNSIAPSENIYKIMSAQGDSSKKIYWTAVGYDTSLFTELQQRDYLDTMKWLAHTRAYVTGFGVYCYRDSGDGYTSGGLRTGGTI